MRRAAVLLLLLCLCGCTQEAAADPAAAAAVPQPEQAALEEVPMQLLKPVEIEIWETPQWRGSEPQEGEPIVPQPGDTAGTWDPVRAAEFPADAECTPMELLEKWLAVEGLTLADLERRDCGQLVLASAQDDGVTTITTCYTRQKDGAWQAEEALTSMPGFMGSRGVAHDRRRGSLQSPAGLWPLGSAFGLAEAPEGLKVPWRDVTDQSDWVTDDDSRYYNTWQERDDPALLDAWNDAEHLADYDETYTYACVIEYNTPPYTVPNRGCAIFLHVSDHPTEGCVGLLTGDMVAVLQWLDPRENPHILITGYNKGS